LRTILTNLRRKGYVAPVSTIEPGCVGPGPQMAQIGLTAWAGKIKIHIVRSDGYGEIDGHRSLSQGKGNAQWNAAQHNQKLGNPN
jgi:hypothetical protein